MIEKSVLVETKDVISIEEGMEMIKDGRNKEEYLLDYKKLIDKSRELRGKVYYWYPYSVTVNTYKNTQIHHIVLRSEGGSDQPSNQVIFTPLEHAISHLLLYRSNPENQKYLNASWSILHRPAGVKGYYKLPNVEMEKILKVVSKGTLEEVRKRKIKRMCRPIVSLNYIQLHKTERIFGIIIEKEFESVKEAALNLYVSPTAIYNSINRFHLCAGKKLEYKDYFINNHEKYKDNIFISPYNLKRLSEIS